MRRRSHRISQVPALESRQLLSGNVVVSFDGTTLRLTGDGSANQISIHQSVGGMLVQSLSGTKLNGVSNATQAFANPSSIVIDLKGGDDTLNLADFLGGQLNIQMGSGNDKVNANSLVCDGAFAIDLGSGNDSLSFQGTLATPSQIGTNLSVLGNSGNDLVVMHRAVINQNFQTDLGSGNDSLGVFAVQFNSAVNVALGSGNDRLSLSENLFRSALSVQADSGNDIVGLGGNQADGNVSVDLGDNNDALLSNGNVFNGNVTRIGGNNTDLLYKSDTVIGTDTITGFETQPSTITPQVQALYDRLNAAFPS